MSLNLGCQLNLLKSLTRSEESPRRHSSCRFLPTSSEAYYRTLGVRHSLPGLGAPLQVRPGAGISGVRRPDAAGDPREEPFVVPREPQVGIALEAREAADTALSQRWYPLRRLAEWPCAGRSTRPSRDPATASALTKASALGVDRLEVELLISYWPSSPEHPGCSIRRAAT